MHPRIVQAQADAIRSQLEDLEREMREYETLRAGGYKLEKLSVVDELAATVAWPRSASTARRRSPLWGRGGDRLGIPRPAFWRDDGDAGKRSLRSAFYS